MAGHHDEFIRLEGKIFTRSFFVLLTLVLIGFFFIASAMSRGSAPSPT